MSENNDPDLKPNTMPAMTNDQVKARAQRILDQRGPPPYKVTYSYNESGNGPGGYHTLQLSEDDAAVISEFVSYWMPFLTIKEKQNGPQDPS